MKQALDAGTGYVGAAQQLLLQQPQQQQEVTQRLGEVRQSFATLLENLAGAQGGQQQQQQQAGPSTSTAAAAGPSSSSSVLQACLGRINWAAYEASMGAFGQSCRHLLDAGAQQVQQQHSVSTQQLSALLQGCFVGILAAHASSTTAPQLSQQPESGRFLEVLVASLRFQQHTVVGSCSLPTLQQPAITYQDPRLAQLLSTPVLQLPHALAGPVLSKVLQPLAVPEVRYSKHACVELMCRSVCFLECWQHNNSVRGRATPT